MISDMFCEHVKCINSVSVQIRYFKDHPLIWKLYSQAFKNVTAWERALRIHSATESVLHSRHSFSLYKLTFHS